DAATAEDASTHATSRTMDFSSSSSSSSSSPAHTLPSTPRLLPHVSPSLLIPPPSHHPSLPTATTARYAEGLQNEDEDKMIASLQAAMDEVTVSPLAQIACHVILRLISQRWRTGLASVEEQRRQHNSHAHTQHQPPSAKTTTNSITIHLLRLKRFASIALCRSRPSTPHLLMHGLLLVHRIVSISGPLPLSLASPTRLLLAGLMLSEAHLSDTQTAASVWARVAAIPEGPGGIATIKREALEALAYGVGVKEDEYAAWVRAVKKCFNKTTPTSFNHPIRKFAETRQNDAFADSPTAVIIPAQSGFSASKAYVDAMNGATIAAASSTVDMIAAVRRARTLLAETKPASPKPTPQSSSTTTTTIAAASAPLKRRATSSSSSFTLTASSQQPPSSSLRRVRPRLEDACSVARHAVGGLRRRGMRRGGSAALCDDEEVGCEMGSRCDDGKGCSLWMRTVMEGDGGSF
ncbi:hypothetical protein HDU67_006138, partial [Dinochytrium kinnereticum]